MTNSEKAKLREIACALQDAHAHALEICKHINQNKLLYPELKTVVNDHLKQWDKNYFHIQKRLKKFYE